MRNTTTETDATAKRVAEQARESLRLRIVSGLILAPAAIVLVWLGGWFFAGLTLVAAVVLNWEWDRLCGGSGRSADVWLLGAAIAGVLVTFHLAMPVWSLGFAAAGAVVGVSKAAAGGGAWMLLGTVYIIAPCVALMWLRAEPMGLATVIWLLAVVWATDTGAYFFGRTIGGPKMAPSISPNKTWAGLIGGAGTAALIGIPAGYLAGTQNYMNLVASGAVLAVIGQVGDVFESSIKRRFGVKDSGNIIPGHGGLFDRLDSLLLVAVVYAAMMVLSDGISVWR